MSRGTWTRASRGSSTPSSTSYRRSSSKGETDACNACFNVSHDLMHDQQNLLTTSMYILYALKPSCNMQKDMKLRYLNPLIHWIFSDPYSKGLWEGVIFFLHWGIRNKKFKNFARYVLPKDILSKGQNTKGPHGLKKGT